MQVVAIAFATLGTGAATLTLMNDDIPDYAVPAGEWEPGSVLDGRTFHTVDTVWKPGKSWRID